MRWVLIIAVAACHGGPSTQHADAAQSDAAPDAAPACLVSLSGGVVDARACTASVVAGGEGIAARFMLETPAMSPHFELHQLGVGRGDPPSSPLSSPSDGATSWDGSAGDPVRTWSVHDTPAAGTFLLVYSADPIAPEMFVPHGTLDATLVAAGAPDVTLHATF